MFVVRNKIGGMYVTSGVQSLMDFLNPNSGYENETGWTYFKEDADRYRTVEEAREKAKQYDNTFVEQI